MYDNSSNVSGVTNPVGQLTTESSYSGGNTYTLQQTAFNVFGESLGQTLTLPAAEGNLAGSYTLTRGLPSGNQALTWTDDGKLASGTTSAGATSYVYDADGNVLLQKDPGQTTLFLFGRAEQLVLDTSTGAVTGTRFLALPGGGQVVRTGAGTAYSFEIGDQQRRRPRPW